MLAASILAMTVRAGPADQWPQWRGPDGIGATSAESFHFDPSGMKVVWVADVPGVAKSSPIVSRSQVFVGSSYQDRSSQRLADGFGQLAALIAGLFVTAVAIRQYWVASTPWLLISGLVSDLTLLCGAAVAMVADFETIPVRPKVFLAGIIALASIIHVTAALRAGRARVWAIAAQLLLLAGSGALFYFVPNRYGLASLIVCAALPRLWLRRGASNDRSPRLAELEAMTAVFVSLTVSAISASAFTAPELFWARAWASNVWFRMSLLLGLGFAAGLALATRRVGHVLGGFVLGSGALVLMVAAPESGWGNVAGLTRALAFGPALLLSAWLVVSGIADWSPKAALQTRSTWAGILTALLAAFTFARANYLVKAETTVHTLASFDADSGRHLWTRELHRESNKQMGGLSSMSATPAANGETIVAYFGSVAAALDYGGNILWKTVEQDYFSDAVYGVGASPLIVENSAIMLREVEDRPRKDATGSSVIARHRLSTGEPIWTTRLPFASNSYSTPVLWRANEHRQLVFATKRKIAGVDFDSGALLWSIDIKAREIVSSLAADTTQLYLAGGSVNGVAMAFKPKQDFSVTPAISWQHQAQSMLSSPVATRDLLFTLSEDGELSCQRSTDGRTLWSETISQNPCYASIVLAGKDLYVVDTAGTIMVFSADPEFHKLGEHKLGEVVYATPALANGRMWVRTETHLFCLR